MTTRVLFVTLCGCSKLDDVDFHYNNTTPHEILVPIQSRYDNGPLGTSIRYTSRKFLLDGRGRDHLGEYLIYKEAM